MKKAKNTNNFTSISDVIQFQTQTFKQKSFKIGNSGMDTFA